MENVVRVELEPRTRSVPLEPRPPVAPPLRRTLGIITLAWVFGSVWFSTTTGEPLTVFAQKLGASNFQFGLLTAIPFLASLMSLPGSLLIEWTGRRKRVFLWSLSIQRVMWLVIAIVPLAILSRCGASAREAALLSFLGLVLLMNSAGAMGGPAWLHWMADIVPRRVNGKYFSRRRQWGILSAVPAAIFAGWFLDRIGDDAGSGATLRWCAMLFLCSAVCGVADIQLFRWVPAAPRPPRKGVELLRALREPLENRAFLNFSAFIGLLTFAVTLLGQFSTLYLLEQVGISNMSVQMALVVTPMLAQLLVLGVWGRVADRLGKAPLITIASIGLVPVGIGWCFVSPGTIWLAYVLSGLGAALWTGIEVANLNLVLEISGTGRLGGSSFAAVNSVITNLAGCLGGVVAGIIAQLLRNWHWQPLSGAHTFTYFDVLFIAGGAVRLISAGVFLPKLRQSGDRSAWEAIRLVASGCLKWHYALRSRSARASTGANAWRLNSPTQPPRPLHSPSDRLRKDAA